MEKIILFLLLLTQYFHAVAGEHLIRPRSRKDASAKAKDFVARLNLTEKTSMITGIQGFDARGCIGNIASIPRVNFTGICLLDGPQAINRADLVSIFPSGILAGATWDIDLIYARAKAMGEEFRGKGGHVQLGPVAGPLGRHGLGGRNWEGFSTDPYLSGKAMAATVRGVQAVGVQACSKHYIGNEQETQRSNSFLENGTEIMGISSNIDDRTLHELYLWPFAEAIQAGSSSIMCSYNRLNQTYACENPRLLNDILRKELGFEGYVVSDWFATHSGAESIQAGLDMNMPGALDQESILSRNGLSYWGFKNVSRMIDQGMISESRIDEMVQRIMLPYFYLHQDSNYPTVDPSLTLTMGAQQGINLAGMGIPEVPSRDVRGDHASLIRRIGADGIVLLKNLNKTLPLKSPKNIGVFGNDAPLPINGIVFEGLHPFEIGTLDIGGGSGTGRNTYLVSPLEAVMAKAKAFGSRVQYVTNNKVLAADDFRSIYPVPDVCLVFLNTFASESWDRTEYEADWNSTLVVENVAKRCLNTVVVTHSAGVNTLPWAKNPNVTAILAAHLPGQESGNAIVDILWGHVNPSAKLPYTIPAQEEDYDIPIVNLSTSKVTSPGAWQADFTEGQYIDYRRFDHSQIDPLYEFGFGLSYTTFKLQDSITVENRAGKVAAVPNPSAEILPGGNVDLWKPILRLRTRVTNTGSVAGATVPQLYLSYPEGTTPKGTPVQVLRGFDKVFLKPGESKEVMFNLMRRDLSFWDVGSQSWTIPSGSFEFKVGFSSRDAKATLKHRVRN
ncbi:glycosyl hydrolase family 3 n terminal domain-containing protein [Fusarium mundagurra]|uniref:Beta-glucosidase cel3A n=1 Tax=Fusarium mundagurra TaxID=1567541 RepID=A0A8H5XRD3_9HYPO|nr:glycosyl hydrolase family 3 n terminal domain-containing protein [Fusarium mundagurra]